MYFCIHVVDKLKNTVKILGVSHLKQNCVEAFWTNIACIFGIDLVKITTYQVKPSSFFVDIKDSTCLFLPFHFMESWLLQQ